MTIAASILTTGFGLSASSFTTASATYTSGKWYVALIQNESTGAGGLNTPTISGWTLDKRINAGTRDVTFTILWFRGDGVTRTLTIDYAAQSQAAVQWHIIEVSGMLASGNPIVQSNTAAGSSTTAATTLSAFADATNNATFSFAGGYQSSMTPAGGYTVISSATVDLAIESTYKVGQDTAPSMTCGNDAWIIYAAEIAVASTGGPATKLGITTALVGNQSGVAFTTQNVVAVQDAGGSTVTTDTSTVTATLNTLTGSGTLGGTTTKAAVAGLANFSGTGLKVTGTGSFTITYSDGALTSVTTPTFYVGATQLAITSAPTTAFSKHASTIVVTAQDGGGSTVANYIGTVAVTLNKLSGGSSVATMTGGTSSAAAVAGVATLTPIATTSDNGLVATSYTYTAAASGLTSATTATITPTVSESIAVTIT